MLKYITQPLVLGDTQPLIPNPFGHLLHATRSKIGVFISFGMGWKIKLTHHQTQALQEMWLAPRSWFSPREAIYMAHKVFIMHTFEIYFLIFFQWEDFWPIPNFRL